MNCKDLNWSFLRKAYPKAIFSIILFGFVYSCSSGDTKIPARSGSNALSAAKQKEISLLEQLKAPGLVEEKKVQLLLSLAQAYLNQNDYDSAATTLKEVLTYKSNYYNPSKVNLELGKAYLGKSQYSSALGYLRNSEKLDRNFEVHERSKLLAKSALEEREYYPALASLSKAYNQTNTKKDLFYYETAAKTFYNIGYSQNSPIYYKKGLEMASLGLKEFPESPTLANIYKECQEILNQSKRN